MKWHDSRFDLLLLGASISIAWALRSFAGDMSLWPYLVGLFILAYAGLLLVTHRYRGSLSTWAILASAIACRLLFWDMPPILSDDAYRYFWDGWIQIQGFNPYAFIPADPVLADVSRQVPVFDAINSKQYFSVYPPLSQILFFFCASLSDGDFSFFYLLYKSIVVLADVLTVILVLKLGGKTAALAYALNPLIIIELVGQGHTEVFALLCIAASLYFYKQKDTIRFSGYWAFLMVGLASLFKIYPLLFGFLFLSRYRVTKATLPCAVCLALCLPYWQPETINNVATSLNLYVQLFEFNAGPYYALKEIGYWVYDKDMSKFLGPWLRTAFLLLAAVIILFTLRRKWAVSKAMLVLYGTYLALSTTVHPWYLSLLILLLAILPARRLSPWHWLSVFTFGTYLFYMDARWSTTVYWVAVGVGWGGWALLGVLKGIPQLLPELMQRRAQKKIELLLDVYPDIRNATSILDLGAGDGYVGARLKQMLGSQTTVSLCDVVDFNKTDLELVVYDGHQLPYANSSIDVVLLIYVLHHSSHQEALIREAVRVSRKRVLIIESTFTSTPRLYLLTFLDHLANRLRSGGLMNDQEKYLHFRTIHAWEQFLGSYASVVATKRVFGLIHQKVVFEVKPEIE